MSSTSPTRRVGALAAVVGCALLASACGSTSPSSAGSPGSTEATVAGVRITVDRSLHDALPSAIKSSGVVRVASDVPYAPFEMYASAGSTQITGIDYDLGQALGAKLGVSFTFSPVKFEGIIAAISAGQYDVAMSDMGDRKAREQQLDFVDYTQDGTAILVAKGNPSHIATFTDLCGKPVSTEAGTNTEKFVDDTGQRLCTAASKPPIDLQTYPKDSDGQLAIKAGKVVAHVLDAAAAGYAAATADQGNSFQVVKDPSAPTGYNSTPNGIAVAKSEPQLADAIQKALQELIDDGTYAKILATYGESSIAVAKAERNAAVS
ncbi:ABC transporter substrate-binding protein [Streptacidiphilus fuscans]|uniref:ABC transporter substrate-binding protein n=1 Tax=Streptacidiphilus fuscans TaxID=2789292 RepID=A0A931FI98_9ACTN|nr:ABC transporter substrate-binding protein [Streptacidiphilus fuscans]MBF9072681.1 ABC transporter substrate-binding protein [Streptacidiphilus fuscans]